MTASIDKSDLQRRMHGAVEALKHDLGGLRTGRASTGVLSAGAGSDLVGQHVVVTYVVDGRTVRARRVMRLTYPEVG